MIVLLVLGLAAAAVAADWFIAEPADVARTYVGRQTCAQCHQQELKAWTGSHHDLAMDLATPETVLGNFDNQEFTHYGVTSRMFRDGEKYKITTDGKKGELETFEIKYTFGVDPLQQYMVEFPDGRVQVLSIAWDTKQKEWFHLYPNERIPHDDVLHWTAPAQNWNYMCAECHSTNLQKNYDLKTNTYHTTFSEIDVSCEACHGPGSLHVKLASQRSLFWDRRHGYGLAKLKGPEFTTEAKLTQADSKGELESCARCHSRRRIVHPDYHPGRDFMDHYEVELLDRDLYHADGQIRDEVYEYGSFTQSLMHRKGVRCSHCHDPHTARLRAEGNQLCGKCHTPAKYDSMAHHYHPMGSKAAQCVECHMPETTYMVVDPRRDHSIRVPRPDLSVQLGVPNACNGCHEHKNETAEWARDKIIDWYGPKRREEPHYALAIAAGRTGQLEKLPSRPVTGSATSEAPVSRSEEIQTIVRRLEALARRKDAGPTVRATAVALLGRYPLAESFEAVRRALKDPEPESRAAAVRALESLNNFRAAEVAQIDRVSPEQMEPLDAALRKLAEDLSPLLNDPVRAVRVEAARVLSIVPHSRMTSDVHKLLTERVDEYRVGQMELADQAAAHLNLGVVYANQGQLEKAEQAYRMALRLDPQFIPARMNLAMQYDQQGRKQESEKLLLEVTKISPEFAEGFYSLGLLVAEDPDRLAEAAAHLEKAAELDSLNARMKYNAGLARQQLGDFDAAERLLTSAAQMQPETPEFLHALAILYAQQRRWPKALAAAQQLAQRFPLRPDFQQMFQQFQQQANQFGPAPP
jgi:predicted CXXCH cytochrome family protein